MINRSSSLLGLKDLIILNIYAVRPYTSHLTPQTLPFEHILLFWEPPLLVLGDPLPPLLMAGDLYL